MKDIYKKAAMALYEELERLVKEDMTEEEVYEAYLAYAAEIISEADAEAMMEHIRQIAKGGNND